MEKPVFLTDRRDYLEDYALALLFNHPELDPDQNRLAVEYFKKTENRELFTSVRSSSTIDEVKENLDESLHEYLDGLIGLRLSPLEDWQVENAFLEITERLEQRYLKELQATLLLTADVKSQTSQGMDMIKDSVSMIFTEEETFEKDSFDEKELDEFFDSLTSDQFLKIRDFFETMPTLKHTVKYKCTTCGEDKETTVQGLNSFFG